MKPLVTIFPTRTATGLGFADEAARIAARCGYQVRVVQSPTWRDISKAIRGVGGVLFDATTEAGDAHNYHVATYPLIRSPYVVLVSRSYLPLNFRGYLEPVAPPYPNSWSNEEVLSKLEERLVALLEHLPKTETTGVSMVDLAEEGVVKFQQIQQQRGREFSVFLSYRYSHEADATHLAQASQRDGKSIRILRSTDLSFPDEILTLQRRWQVLRDIYTWLEAANEFWVLWSDDYLSSWWTRGEIVSLALLGHYRTLGLQIVAAQNQSTKAPDTLVPKLTSRQKRTMEARFFVCKMPESLPRLQSLKASRLARVLLGLKNDSMLLPSFSHVQMLECSHGADTRLPRRALDVDEFLEGGLSSLTGVSEPLLSDARRTGMLSCPSCGAPHHIVIGPPRYLWHPITGTGLKGRLEECPVYRATAA
jgi:hypothetical protein